MRALIISGGGAKGSFAVGVLSKLIREFGNDYDIIGGTSTGALIAPFAALHDIKTLEEVYLGMTTDELLTLNSPRQTFDKGRIFEVDGLKNKVTKKLDPETYKKVISTNKLIFFSTVCLQTKKIVYFHTGNNMIVHDDDLQAQPISGYNMFIDAIMGSSNQPALMPVVPIEYNGNKYEFVDGGVREYIPIRGAIYNGATEIDVIIHTPEVPKKKDDLYNKEIVKVLTRTIDILTDDVAFNDLEIGKKLALSLGNISMRIYRPDDYDELLEDDLNFDPADMKSCYDKGVVKANKPELFPPRQKLKAT